MITPNNWTSSHYNLGELRAFISFGADIAPQEDSTKAVDFIYFVTVTDKDYQEIFQSSHSNIDEAIELINSKYSQWKFKDALAIDPADGCSSCSAH